MAVRLRVGVALAVNTFIPLHVVMSADRREGDYDVLLVESGYIDTGSSLSEQTVAQLARGSVFEEVHVLPTLGVDVSEERNPLRRVAAKVRQLAQAKAELDAIFRPLIRRFEEDGEEVEVVLYADQPIHFPTHLVRGYFSHARHILVPHGIQLFAPSCGEFIADLLAKKESASQYAARVLPNRLLGLKLPAPSEWYWDEEVTLHEPLHVAPVARKVEWDGQSIQPLYEALPEQRREAVQAQVDRVLGEQGADRMVLLLPLGILDTTYDLYLEWFSEAISRLPHLKSYAFALKPHPALRDPDVVRRFCYDLGRRVGIPVAYLDELDGLVLELVIPALPLAAAIGCASGSLFVVHRLAGLTPYVLDNSLEHIARMAPDLHKSKDNLYRNLFSYCEPV